MMNKRLSRVCALLLCLVFSLGAAAESPYALRFTLQAAMHPENYPPVQQQALQGIADLLNGLTVSGTLDAAPENNHSFDTTLHLSLQGDDASAVDLRWFGNTTHWQIETALLGDQSLMINQLAMPEFAMKTQSYLDLKLQPLVLALSPYSTREAPLFFLQDTWNGIFNAQSGSRTIAKADVLRFARFMTDNANYDHHFRYAVDCVFSLADLQDQMHEWIENMVEWADTAIAEDGIQIMVNQNTEIWTTGTTVLYQKTADGEKFNLPKLTGDIGISLSRTSDTCSLLIEQAGKTMIGFELHTANLPTALPWVGQASLEATVQIEQDVQHMLWQLQGTEEGFTALQLQPDTHAILLELHGTWEAMPSAAPSFDLKDFTGVNILSVNDTTLPEFVRSVKEPLAKGLLPVLCNVPAAAFDTAFRLLDRYQIMNLLLNNAVGDPDGAIDADDT